MRHFCARKARACEDRQLIEVAVLCSRLSLFLAPHHVVVSVAKTTQQHRIVVLVRPLTRFSLTFATRFLAAASWGFPSPETVSLIHLIDSPASGWQPTTTMLPIGKLLSLPNLEKNPLYGRRVETDSLKQGRSERPSQRESERETEMSQLEDPVNHFPGGGACLVPPLVGGPALRYLVLQPGRACSLLIKGVLKSRHHEKTPPVSLLNQPFSSRGVAPSPTTPYCRVDRLQNNHPL